jgi:hypothetical protein
VTAAFMPIKRRSIRAALGLAVRRAIPRRNSAPTFPLVCIKPLSEIRDLPLPALRTPTVINRTDQPAHLRFTAED